MKVHFEIDCTPEEARAFFGLPDLAPVHAAYVDKMKSMMLDGLSPADFEKVAKSWMPGFSEGFEQWRQLLMSAMPKPPQ